MVPFFSAVSNRDIKWAEYVVTKYHQSLEVKGCI